MARARANLSEQLAGRIGQRTDKGTRITESVVARVKADESLIVSIENDNTEQFFAALDQAMANALESIGLAAERFAKEETPTDTGRLKNSITHSLNIEGKEVYVGTNVEYAPYVELGTHGHDGVHMLRHAAENHVGFYREILESELSGQ